MYYILYSVVFLSVCYPALTGGVIFDEIPRLEGDVVTRQCSDVSSKFTRFTFNKHVDVH